jgi:hypothetical protein
MYFLQRIDECYKKNEFKHTMSNQSFHNMKLIDDIIVDHQ